MDNLLLVKETLEKETGMVLQKTPTMYGLQAALATYINGLILNDFDKLVYLLYRIDINEKLIKQLLQEAETTPAGETIAKTIIERQLQKIISRKDNTPPADANCEEEKW